MTERNKKPYLQNSLNTLVNSGKKSGISVELLEETRSELLRQVEKTRKEKSKRYSVNNQTEFEIRKGNLVITTFVGDYQQKIELTSFLDRLRNRVKSSQYYKISVDNVRTLLRNCFSDLDLRVSCTCGDWKYRLAYRATQDGYIYGEKENRPAEKTNPHDTKGSLCKHLARVLSNYSWLSFLSGVVYRYLRNHVDELAKAFNIPDLKDYFARGYNRKQQQEVLKEPDSTEETSSDSSQSSETEETPSEAKASEDDSTSDSDDKEEKKSTKKESGKKSRRKRKNDREQEEGDDS